MDTESEENEKNTQNAKTWNNYVDRIKNPVPINTTDLTDGPGKSTVITRDDTSVAIKEEKMDEEVSRNY